MLSQATPFEFQQAVEELDFQTLLPVMRDGEVGWEALATAPPLMTHAACSGWPHGRTSLRHRRRCCWHLLQLPPHQRQDLLPSALPLPTALEEFKADEKEHRRELASKRSAALDSGLTPAQLAELQQKLFAEARARTLSDAVPPTEGAGAGAAELAAGAEGAADAAALGEAAAAAAAAAPGDAAAAAPPPQ